MQADNETFFSVGIEASVSSIATQEQSRPKIIYYYYYYYYTFFISKAKQCQELNVDGVMQITSTFALLEESS